MTIINLLPWREQARQESKIRFLIMLVIAAGCTVILAFIYYLYFNSRLAHQERNINWLQFELGQEKTLLNKEIAAKTAQMTTIANINFIFSLRKSGYQAVQLLDELMRIVPDGILLTELKREKNIITLTGKAESNLQVTVFMENLAKSRFFQNAVLTEISGKEASTGEERSFKLKFQQK